MIIFSIFEGIGETIPEEGITEGIISEEEKEGRDEGVGTLPEETNLLWLGSVLGLIVIGLVLYFLRKS